MHARSRSTRLVSDEPLPPYSYVTGRFPHPTRDPSGHSFGHAAAPSRRSIRRDGAIRAPISWAAICSTTATTGKPTKCGKVCGMLAGARE